MSEREGYETKIDVSGCHKCGSHEISQTGMTLRCLNCGNYHVLKDSGKRVN
jgi:hypothetical protein